MDNAGLENNRRSFKLLGFVVIIAILGVSLIIATNYSTHKKDSTSKTRFVIESAKVSITKDGLLPATIKIKKGQAVTWTNQDVAIHQVAADPYPSHSSLPDLISDPLSKNDSYSFSFDSSGTYTYHDEINPLKITGTIIVE